MASRHWIILTCILLLYASGALAQEQHCCDYRKEPDSQWHPEPPECVAIEEDCLLEPPEYDLCIEGIGKYTARERYPAPPTSEEVSIVNYYCTIPEPDNLDLTITGNVTPCDQETDCTADNACYDANDTSFDADSDGDNDYCLSGTWQDCLADEQCSLLHTCIDNDCVLKEEAEAMIGGIQGTEHLTIIQRIISFGGRIIKLIINIFT